MKNKIITFLLALLVLLAATTLRRTTPGVSPMPQLSPAIGIAIGPAPIPFPYPPENSDRMNGGAPTPYPRRGHRAIGDAPIPYPAKMTGHRARDRQLNLTG